MNIKYVIFSSFFPSFFAATFVLIWQKLDANGEAKYIAFDDKTTGDDKRITVEISRSGQNSGSTLVIGLADGEDAGQYICSMGASGEQEVKHTVMIRGKLFSIQPR